MTSDPPVTVRADDPLIAAFRVAVAARGGKVKRTGTDFAVTGCDGVQRTAVVAGVRENSEGHSTGVRVLVDVTKASPEFFLFHTSRDGRDQAVESISVAQWVSAKNAWHKLKLGAASNGPSPSERRSVSGRQLQRVRAAQLSESSEDASRAPAAAKPRPTEPNRVNTDGADRGVKVTLSEVEVSATFDPITGEITLGDVPGHRKLSGKKFRNAAVAAATVKSRIAGHTVFSVGSSDWTVIGDRSTRLDTYREQAAG